jgi:hypothetical protein
MAELTRAERNRLAYSACKDESVHINDFVDDFFKFTWFLYMEG